MSKPAILTNTKSLNITKRGGRAKREVLSRELIIKQLEVLAHSRKPETAAKKLGAGYATYLARFRRAGISVKEAERRLKSGEMPEAIAYQLFPEKPYKAYPATNSASLQARLVKDITELVQAVVHSEMQAA